MKFQNLLFYTVLAIGLLCLSGCQASKGKVVAHVPYKTVENYFVRNDVEGMPPMIIKASDELKDISEWLRQWGLTAVRRMWISVNIM